MKEYISVQDVTVLLSSMSLNQLSATMIAAAKLKKGR